MSSAVLHGPYIYAGNGGPMLLPGEEWSWSLGPVEWGAFSVTAHPYDRRPPGGPDHAALSVTEVWAVRHNGTGEPYVNARVRNVGKVPVDVILAYLGVTTF